MLAKESKPNLSHSQVKEVIRRLYGLKASVIRPLPSYDDQNFYVESSEGGEYVLKIMNSTDSQNVTLMELQTHAMNFVHQNGLPAQTALPTLTGELMSLEEFGKSKPVNYCKKKCLSNKVLYVLSFTVYFLVLNQLFFDSLWFWQAEIFGAIAHLPVWNYDSQNYPQSPDFV